MAEAMLVGVDVGGTFSDLVLVDEASGAVCMAQVPTTVAHQITGVVLTAADPPALDGRVPYELRRRGRR